MKKSKDLRQMEVSDFYCTRCGNKGICIPRVGKYREPGHLKKLYCLTCDKEVNMVEIRPHGKYTIYDFWLEFSTHNFDEEGNRIKPWKEAIRDAEKQR